MDRWPLTNWEKRQLKKDGWNSRATTLLKATYSDLLPKHNWLIATRCLSGETSTQLQTGLSLSERMSSWWDEFWLTASQTWTWQTEKSAAIALASANAASALVFFFFWLAYFRRTSHLCFFRDSHVRQGNILNVKRLALRRCLSEILPERRCVWKSVAPSNVRKSKQLVFANSQDECLTFSVPGRTP